MNSNWKAGVLITLLYFIVVSVAGFSEFILTRFSPRLGSIIYFAIYLLAALPMAFGFYWIFLRLCKENKPLDVAEVFFAFNCRKYYTAGIVVQILYSIYIFLWSLLLIVPGIIKACSYMLAPFIVAENPDINPKEAIKLSEKMMEGHKMQLFKMVLGTLGCVVLSMFLAGIPMLWITPYYMAVYTNFYLAVKAEYATK